MITIVHYLLSLLADCWPCIVSHMSDLVDIYVGAILLGSPEASDYMTARQSRFKRCDKHKHT